MLQGPVTRVADIISSVTDGHIFCRHLRAREPHTRGLSNSMRTIANRSPSAWLVYRVQRRDSTAGWYGTASTGPSVDAPSVANDPFSADHDGARFGAVDVKLRSQPPASNGTVVWQILRCRRRSSLRSYSSCTRKSDECMAYDQTLATATSAPPISLCPPNETLLCPAPVKSNVSD